MRERCLFKFPGYGINKGLLLLGQHFILHSDFIGQVSLDLESNVTMQLFDKPNKTHTFSILRSSFVKVSISWLSTLTLASVKMGGGSVRTRPHYWPTSQVSVAVTLEWRRHPAWWCSVWSYIIVTDSDTGADTCPVVWLKWKYSISLHTNVKAPLFTTAPHLQETGQNRWACLELSRLRYICPNKKLPPNCNLLKFFFCKKTEFRWFSDQKKSRPF